MGTCPQGHPRTGENTYTYLRDGRMRRECLECKRARARRHWRKGHGLEDTPEHHARGPKPTPSPFPNPLRRAEHIPDFTPRRFREPWEE
jgi:hypothetical protein